MDENVKNEVVGSAENTEKPVRDAIQSQVNFRRLAGVLVEALEAEDTIVIKTTGETISRPNWNARIRAAELIRDTIDGRPAQVEIKERRSIKIDSAEALVKLARKSPAYRRTLENALIQATGGGGPLRDADRVDAPPPPPPPTPARKAAEAARESGTEIPPSDSAEFDVV